MIIISVTKVDVCRDNALVCDQCNYLMIEIKNLHSLANGDFRECFSRAAVAAQGAPVEFQSDFDRREVAQAGLKNTLLNEYSIYAIKRVYT